MNWKYSKNIAFSVALITTVMVPFVSIAFKALRGINGFAWDQLSSTLLYISTMCIVFVLISLVAILKRKRTVVELAWIYCIVQLSGFCVLWVALLSPYLMLLTNTRTVTHSSTNITDNHEVRKQFNSFDKNAPPNSLWQLQSSWAEDHYCYYVPLTDFSSQQVDVRTDIGLPLRCLHASSQIDYVGKNLFEYLSYLDSTLVKFEFQPVRFAANTFFFISIPLLLIRVIRNVRRLPKGLHCIYCGYMIRELTRCPECGKERIDRYDETLEQKEESVPTIWSHPVFVSTILGLTFLLPIIWYAWQFLNQGTYGTFRDAWKEPLQLFLTFLLVPLCLIIAAIAIKYRTRADVISVATFVSLSSLIVIGISIVAPLFLTSTQFAQAPPIPILDNKLLNELSENFFDGAPFSTDEHLGLSTWAMDDYVYRSSGLNPQGQMICFGREDLGLPLRCVISPLYFRYPRPDRWTYVTSLPKTLLYSLILPVPLALNTIIVACVLVGIRFSYRWWFWRVLRTSKTELDPNQPTDSEVV